MFLLAVYQVLSSIKIVHEANKTNETLKGLQCWIHLVTPQNDLFLGIVDSLGSMQLLSRGAGGSGEKVAPPQEDQQPPHQPAAARKPAVPPKPQVRIPEYVVTLCSAP